MILQQIMGISQTGKMKCLPKCEINTKIINILENEYIKIADENIENFTINKDNFNILKNSLRYFLGIEGEYSLDKGLMLCGTFGVGKSTLFSTMRDFINKMFPFNPNSFIISSIEVIITEQNLIYSKYVQNVDGSTCNPKHLLINEFGHSYNIKNYGSESDDIVESFLMKRYDLFQYSNILTHITTNLSKNEIIKTYPPVIIDRFVEMLNIVEMDGKSFRK